MIISFRLNAQPAPGARMMGMANSSVSLSDISSFSANQAGLTGIKRKMVAINYHKDFARQQISSQTMVLAIPFPNQTLALGLYRYGFDSYKNQQIGFAYARKFGPVLSAALAFHYHQLSIPNYGKSNTFSVDAGLMYQLNHSVSLGAHINNISQNSFDKDLVYADLPLSMQFGMAYRNSEQVLIALSVEQTLNANTDVKLGLEYEPLSMIALRGAYQLIHSDNMRV